MQLFCGCAISVLVYIKLNYLVIYCVIMVKYLNVTYKYYYVTDQHTIKMFTFGQ